MILSYFYKNTILSALQIRIIVEFRFESRVYFKENMADCKILEKFLFAQADGSA